MAEKVNESVDESVDELDLAVPKRRSYARLDSVSGVRLDAKSRAIAMKLGNGNLSQGVRFALYLAANQSAQPAKLSTVLRSAAQMAESMERSLHSPC